MNTGWMRLRCRYWRAHLIKAVAGCLPERRRRGLERHIARCDACRQDREQLEETAGLLRAFAPAYQERFERVDPAAIRVRLEQAREELRGEGSFAPAPGVAMRRTPAWRGWALARGVASRLALLCLGIALGWLLRSASLQEPVPYHVHGIAFADDMGRPAQGALLAAFPEEQFRTRVLPALQTGRATLSPTELAAVRPAAHGWVDHHGSVSLPVWRPGTYYIVCQSGGADSPVLWRRVSVSGRGRSPRVEFRVGGDGLPEIEGRAVDSSGQPVGGAMVTYRIEGERVSGSGACVTDEDGAFRIRAWHEGSYTVAVSAKGLRAEPRVVVVRAGQAVPTLRFTLAGAVAYGEIRGRVLLPDGQRPAAGVLVVPYAVNRRFDGANWSTGFNEVMFHAKAAANEQRTDANGEFRIAGLPPGEYQVAAFPQGMPSFPPSEREEPRYPFAAGAEGGKVMVRAGESAQVRPFALGGAGTIRGSVRSGETRRGVAQAYVRAVREDRSDIRTPDLVTAHQHRWLDAKTDANGEFVIHSVVPGRYVLLADTESIPSPARVNADARPRVLVEAGKEARVTLELPGERSDGDERTASPAVRAL